MDAIYARQSLDKKDSISIETQIEFCKKEVNNEQFQIYIDKGFSGKNTERPQFQEMIHDIELGKINKVIVYKLDRISRSVLDFSNMIDIFEKKKVEFISTTEKFDTGTPIGRAMLGIIIIFAQLERETIQQRITDNYYARGNRGLYMGGGIPYAFEKETIYVDNKKASVFVEIEDQMQYLKWMFETYAYTNTSLGRIVAYLNENGIKTKRGTVWDNAKLSSILKNPIYVKADADIYKYYKNKGCIINNDIEDFVGENGCFLFGKRNSNERKFTNVANHTLSLGLHKGVIDSHTFLTIQNKMDNNKQVKRSGSGKNSWLSGVIKCGYCNYSMSALKHTSSKKEYFYFICRKKHINVCQGHNKTIYAKEIEDIVESRLLKKIQQLNIDKININNNNNMTINKLKVQITEKEIQIENLINKLMNSNKTVTKYINDKISQLDKEKQELIIQIEKEEEKNTKLVSIKEVSDKINNWTDLTLEEKKEICKTYIEKVFVFNDEIKIKWAIDNEDI